MTSQSACGAPTVSRMTIELTLNTGVTMPALGLGVFQSPPEETTAAVEAALATGYRHVDTAAAYGNEREVGEGLRRSGLDRSDVFVETKVWVSDYGYDETLHAWRKATGKLGLEQLDLLILHQPATDRFEQRNIVDAYATFNHDFDGWSLAWGGGGSWAVTEAGPSQGGTKGAFYQTGLNLTFGNLGVGGAFEYYKNGLVFAQSSALPGTGEAAGDVDSVIPHQDMWVAGGGVSYKIDATTLGLQYSYSDMEGLTTANANRYIHTVALTANYDLGPGIAINGALEYVRADGQHDDDAHNGYNSVGLGLGTSFTF